MQCHTSSKQINQKFMTHKILLYFCCLLSSVLYAQETMTVNSKIYPATPTWNFICENYAYSGLTQIQIAQTEKGGLLKITVETNNTSYAIAGNVYVDLTDMSAIVCTDKNQRETHGNKTTSYYSLTATEMNRLRKTEIQAVRYYIKGIKNKFSSQTGYFTAFNKKRYFATVHDNAIKSYDTVTAMALLHTK